MRTTPPETQRDLLMCGRYDGIRLIRSIKDLIAERKRADSGGYLRNTLSHSIVQTRSGGTGRIR